MMFHLGSDERVENVIRKHWFVLLEQFVALFVLFIVPFVFYRIVAMGIVPAAALGDIILGVEPATLRLLAALWSLVFWMRFFALYTDHFLDAWILTNRHLIDIEQKGFFHREVATLDLSDIEDIAIETRGFLPTLLNFGTIRVQTAGTSREFIIRNAPRPERAKEILLGLRKERGGAA